jgi:hypothetical protein
LFPFNGLKEMENLAVAFGLITVFYGKTWNTVIY